MKKNKEHRVFSRVLSRLAWANFYHVCGENDKAYKAVLDAKRWLEECDFEGVKAAFYDREYHLQFTVYRYRDGLNRYYTVSASHGYVNSYHRSNRYEIRDLTGRLEFSRDCTLRRDYSDYLTFQQRAGNVLYWGLSQQENHDYWYNGDIHDIPYDVSIQLWRDLRECVIRVVNESIAYKKVLL